MLARPTPLPVHCLHRHSDSGGRSVVSGAGKVKRCHCHPLRVEVQSEEVAERSCGIGQVRSEVEGG